MKYYFSNIINYIFHFSVFLLSIFGIRLFPQAIKEYNKSGKIDLLA